MFVGMKTQLNFKRRAYQAAMRRILWLLSARVLRSGRRQSSVLKAVAYRLPFFEKSAAKPFSLMCFQYSGSL